MGYLKTKAINDNDEVNETDELNYLGLNEKKKRIEEHLQKCQGWKLKFVVIQKVNEKPVCILCRLGFCNMHRINNFPADD